MGGLLLSTLPMPRPQSRVYAADDKHWLSQPGASRASVICRGPFYVAWLCRKTSHTRFLAAAAAAVAWSSTSSRAQLGLQVADILAPTQHGRVTFAGSMLNN